MLISDELRDALRDENGLAPTGAALTVLTEVLTAIDGMDTYWGQERDGIPTEADYADHIVSHLVETYNLHWR
jgi:hypothetical protein